MTVWYIFDNNGRSYYEGRIFETRNQATKFAREISENERLYGVWIGTDDDPNLDEEIFPSIEH